MCARERNVIRPQEASCSAGAKPCSEERSRPRGLWPARAQALPRQIQAAHYGVLFGPAAAALLVIE